METAEKIKSNVMETGLTYENCYIFKSNHLTSVPYNIAGQIFDTEEAIKQVIRQKLWFTYRSGFEPISQDDKKSETVEFSQNTHVPVAVDPLPNGSSPNNSTDSECILTSPDHQEKSPEKENQNSGYFSSYLNTFSSDAGWGCAVRVGQMLLGEVFQRLVQPKSIQGRIDLLRLGRFFGF